MATTFNLHRSPSILDGDLFFASLLICGIVKARKVVIYMMFSGLNWWAIIVCSVVAMVVGAFWYSPTLFAKSWMKELGKKESELGSANTGYIIAMASNVIMTFMLANAVHGFATLSIWDGAGLGLAIWIGFIATTAGMNYTFSGRSFKLFSIDTGLQLVVLIINGAILSVWR